MKRILINDTTALAIEQMQLDETLRYYLNTLSLSYKDLKEHFRQHFIDNLRRNVRPFELSHEYIRSEINIHILKHAMQSILRMIPSKQFDSILDYLQSMVIALYYDLYQTYLITRVAGTNYEVTPHGVYLYVL